MENPEFFMEEKFGIFHFYPVYDITQKALELMSVHAPQHFPNASFAHTVAF